MSRIYNPRNKTYFRTKNNRITGKANSHISLILLGIVLAIVVLIVAMPVLGATPQDPYIVGVTVNDGDGNAVSGATVTVTHVKSGESDSTTTNSDGWCFIPLDSLTTYADGDTVKVVAVDGTESAETTFQVDLSSGNEWGTDVVLTLSPATIPILLTGEMWAYVVVIGIIVVTIIAGVLYYRKS